MWAKIAAGAAQCRVEAGEQGGRERADKSVEEDAPVEADLFRARKRFGEVVEELDSAAGEHKAEDGAQDGEQQHFTEQLCDDGTPRCAEREADGELALAVGSAGEQQRGDIDAGNEQQEDDGAIEKPERGADVADDDGFERLDVDGEVAIGFGKLRAELVLDGGEIGKGLLLRHAGPQAADDVVPGGGAVLCDRRVGRSGLEEIHIASCRSESWRAGRRR